MHRGKQTPLNPDEAGARGQTSDDSTYYTDIQSAAPLWQPGHSDATHSWHFLVVQQKKLKTHVHLSLVQLSLELLKSFDDSNNWMRPFTSHCKTPANQGSLLLQGLTTPYTDIPLLTVTAQPNTTKPSVKP